MRFIGVFKRYSTLFLALLLIVFIVGVLAELIYLNSTGVLKFNTITKNLPPINYTGYDTLKQQVDAAALNSNINQSPHFSKFQTFLQNARDASKSEKERYTILQQAHIELLYLYTFSSDAKVRILMDALSSFAKTNFSKEYIAGNFSYPCNDPSCADTPQDPQFLSVIDELKNSDMPAAVKTDMSQYLLSLSYYSKSQSLDKARLILATASNFRSYNAMSQTGANIKIADALLNYVKNNYPNEYKTLTQPPAVKNTANPTSTPKK